MKKIALFIGILFVLPTFVFATTNTVEELQSQIANLLKLVAQLQSQLAAQNGSSGGISCHTFNTDLKVGDQNEEVSFLLAALARDGVAAPRSTNFSHTYDEIMASYVSAFQEKYRSEILTPAGLSSPSGYFGARTRAKLNQLYGCSTTATPLPGIYPDSPVMCTSDAKLCPDGSYVGRSGPKCEFSACPAPTTNTSAAKPDLMVVATKCDFGNPPETYGKISCEITVYNNSAVEITKSFDVNIQGTTVTVQPPFKAWEKRLVKSPTTFGLTIPGINELNFPIDIWNSVDESNESNNSGFLKVNVEGTPGPSAINILTPNGGEQWQSGSTQTIKWSDTAGSNNGTYTVFITSENGSGYGIAGEVYGQNYLNWTVGQVKLGDQLITLSPGSNYYVQIVKQYTSTYTNDQSDRPFSIVSTAPNISYISPTSAKIGDTITVYGSNLYGNIVVFDGSSLSTYATTYGFPNTSGNMMTFTVPTTASVGSHTIQVEQRIVGGLSNSKTLSVISNTPTNGTLSFSQRSFDFSYTQNGQVPSFQHITFTNTSNVNVRFTLDVPSQPNWLKDHYSTGTYLNAGPGVATGLSATVDPTGLNPGTYTTYIVVKGNFAESPIEIPVTLKVLSK